MKSENVLEYVKAGKKSINGLRGQMRNEIGLSMKDKKKWAPTGILIDISELGIVLKRERKDKSPEYLLHDWEDIDYIFWSGDKQ